MSRDHRLRAWRKIALGSEKPDLSAGLLLPLALVHPQSPGKASLQPLLGGVGFGEHQPRASTRAEQTMNHVSHTS